MSWPQRQRPRPTCLYRSMLIAPKVRPGFAMSSAAEILTRVAEHVFSLQLR